MYEASMTTVNLQIAINTFRDGDSEGCQSFHPFLHTRQILIPFGLEPH